MPTCQPKRNRRLPKNILLRRLPEPREAIVDRQIQSADDIKAVAQDKVVHRRDGAGRGIFHRQNAVTALAVFHRAEHILLRELILTPPSKRVSFWLYF